MNNEPKVLSEAEIEEKIKELPSGWKYKDNSISKEFIFDSISQGVVLLDKLIPFCDKIDHHPDIHIYYKKFIFELTRYSVGDKVTERDFLVAKEIERLYSQRSKLQ